MLIRPLSVDDAAQWRRLRLEALQAHPTAFLDSYEEASQRDLAAFAARIPSPDGGAALFGAFKEDVLSGAAGVYIHHALKERHIGTLWGVYVAPDLRGQGVGTALVKAVIAHARNHVLILQATVLIGNEEASALYRSLGFVSYGLDKYSVCVEGKYYDQNMIVIRFDEAALISSGEI